jgi:beta-lactamase regulating signal transducer with metallopeptidase domain
MIAEILTHVWQSTFFAIAAGLLTLLFRNNRAKVRFGLWLAASLKFFVPFALLIQLGSQIHWTPAAHQIATRYATPAVAFAVDSVAEPFGAISPIASPAPKPLDWTLIAFLALWTAGFLTVTVIRLRLWLRIRRLMCASTLVNIPANVEIRSAPGLLEPGVVGITHPVLLLPDGIGDRLTPTELEAVLAHELCHVRRRDNLFAAIHMLGEALFWFHPLVWWIGARLLEERERACDEDVLNLGKEPRIYADAILGVCRLYAESPLVCVSGVTGSNIRRRIEAIMLNRRGQKLNRAKKILLATAALMAMAFPVAVGIVIGLGNVPAILAQSPLAAITSLSPAAIPTLAQATPAPAIREPQMSPAAAGTSSTPRVAAADHSRTMTAMLFDFSGMTPADQARAREIALDRVHAGTPPDVVCVMLGGSGPLKVAQDFTDNVSALETAIENLQPAGDSAESSAALRLANIETAAKMLAHFPQRKMLLYFSASLTEAADQDPAELQSAIKAAMQANIAIFPVDVRHVAPSKELSQLEGYIDQVASSLSQLARQYGDNYPPLVQQQIQLQELKLMREALARRLQPQAAVTPAGVSPAEYGRRLKYAEATFGSATKNPMGRSYVRYGPPDQIETPTASTEIWRYNYLDDYHGGAAFEFPKGSFSGVRILYPQPEATSEGAAAEVAQLASLTGGLRGGANAADIKSGFPGSHISIQVYSTAPGTAPSPDRRFVPVSIPLDFLSGSVDIIGQIRARLDDGTPGQIMAQLADTAHAPSATYQAGFTLRPGTYMCRVLVREQSSGRIFGEAANFEVK